MSRWTAAIPVYVTRKTAHGETGSWSVGAIWGLIVVWLTLVNMMGWGIYGVYELISKIA